MLPTHAEALWRAQLPSAEDVEFWVAPEKAGWLQSQGDHIKTWRRRWFVLKQGFLFRFASQDVTSASKPRGLVDLSKASARMRTPLDCPEHCAIPAGMPYVLRMGGCRLFVWVL